MMTKNKPQPSISVPAGINVQCAEITAASNGVKIHTVCCGDDDVVRVSFVFHAGSSMQEHPFQASVTANMLSEGTSEFTSHQISEKLDFYGSYFDVSMDRDYVVVTFCALTKFFAPTMEVASQILLHPVFPQHELDVYCSKRKQRLAIERSKIAFRSREYLSRALFGPEHPYGVSYPGEEYDNIRREEIVAFYEKFYTAANCFVVCSGKISDEISGSILGLASELPEGRIVANVDFPVPQTEKHFCERQPEALQSAIRIGTVLFNRSHPDFIAMQVVTAILGGYFGSRLVRNLREKNGFTYGVFAGMVNLEKEGYMAISTEVAASATAQAIAEIYKEIDRLREELVPDAELDMVKNIMAGEVMRVLDGPFGIADVTIENRQNGLDNSYLNRFMDYVRAVTPQRIKEVATKYFARDRFTTVVVGENLPDDCR